MKSAKFPIIIILLNIAFNNFSYAQFFMPTNDTNYYDIVSHNDNIFQADTFGGNEGAFARYRHWKSFWPSRLYPTGSFKVAADAMGDFFSSSSNSNNLLSPGNWTDLGPSSGNASGLYQWGGGGIGQITRIAFHPDFDGTTPTPSNPYSQTIYAGALSGGVWATNNDGQFWTNLNTDKQFDFLNVNALAVDPHLNSQANPKHNIFAGIGDGSTILTAGIYRTQDGGQNWTKVNSGLQFPIPGFSTIGQFAFNPLTSNETFAATSDGLYHTTNSDGVCNWSRNTSLGQVYLRSAVYHPSYSPTNKVIYTSGYDIFKSTDDGTTWVSMTGSGTGLNFSDISQFPSGTVVDGIILGVTPDASNYLYASIITHNPDPNNPICSNPYIDSYYWFFIFNGTQWMQSGTPTTSYCWNPFPSLPCSNTYCDYYGSVSYPFSFSTCGISSTYGGWTTSRISMAISPIQNIGNNHEIDIGQDNLYKSVNNGSSFCCCIGGYCGGHADIHDIAFSPVTNLLYMANDGGIFKRNPSGNWNLISEGLSVGLITGVSSSPTSSNLILVGRFDEGSFLLDKTRSAGQNWKWVTGNDGEKQLIAPNDQEMFSVAAPSLRIEHSKDGWGSFNNNLGFGCEEWDGGFWDCPFVLEPSENKIYVGVNELDKKLNPDINEQHNCSSQDVTWLHLSSFQGEYSTCGPIHTFAIASTDKNYIYAATENRYFAFVSSCPPSQPSRLFRTKQGGGTTGNCPNPNPSTGSCWEELFPPNAKAITSIAIHPENPEKIWITYSGYSAGNKVKTFDGITNTWSDYSNGLPNLPANSIVFEKGSNDGLYVGTDVGVYYTNKDLYPSQGWIPFNNGFPNVIVTELEINYTANKIRAATFGRGLWESNLACPTNFDLNYTTSTSSNLSNTFQEAENNITITANTGNINLTNFTARAGNEIVITATGNNEVVIGPNSDLFIHACNHPGNSFRQQNTNPRGDVTPYTSSLTPPTNEEEKKIYESENVKYTFYPNPFTDHLHIDFLLEKSSQVQVSVYNGMGQLIEILANGNYDAGKHTLLFNNPSVKSGLYFVRMDFGEKHFTKAVLKVVEK